MLHEHTKDSKSTSLDRVFWPMGFLRRFPISGIFGLRDGSLKKRSILGHFLEVLEFRGANLIMKTKPCAHGLKGVRIRACWSN